MNHASKYLRALIHRILDDSAQPFIPRRALCVPGASFDPEVWRQLKLWEQEGYLRILRTPDQTGGDDYVVEMLKYIDQKSPIPGFLNYS